MTFRSRSTIWTGLIVLAGVVACGGGDDGGGPPASGRKTVLVANNSFQPATVSIEPGDTILWSWVAGAIEHNVISYGAPTFTNKGTEVGPGGGTNETDYFAAPESYEVIFPTAGEYSYFCSTHGNKTTETGMVGQVIVN